jgi:hypothetical protein
LKHSIDAMRGRSQRSASAIGGKRRMRRPVPSGGPRASNVLKVLQKL